MVPIHSVWRRPDCDFSSRAQTQARLLRQLASLGSSLLQRIRPRLQGALSMESAAHYRRLHGQAGGLGQGCFHHSQQGGRLVGRRQEILPLPFQRGPYPLYGGEGSLQGMGAFPGRGKSITSPSLCPSIGTKNRKCLPYSTDTSSATLGTTSSPGFPGPSTLIALGAP